MQPVQLSLLPETCPAPSTALPPTPSPDRPQTPATVPWTPTAAQTAPVLPSGPLAEAVTLMGRLIAEAATHVTDGPETGDE